MSAPIGPRLPIQIVHDTEGTYKVFTGKHCQAEGCGLQLTSRNRYDLKLLCREHGRAKERERNRINRTTAPRATRKTNQPVQPPRPFDLQLQEAHSLIDRWWANPISVQHPMAELKRLMDNHEISARFRQDLKDSGFRVAMPPVDAAINANPPQWFTEPDALDDCDDDY